VQLAILLFLIRTPGRLRPYLLLGLQVAGDDSVSAAASPADQGHQGSGHDRLHNKERRACRMRHSQGVDHGHHACHRQAEHRAERELRDENRRAGQRQHPRSPRRNRRCRDNTALRAAHHHDDRHIGQHDERSFSVREAGTGHLPGAHGMS
jgi:hypothetical protein